MRGHIAGTLIVAVSLIVAMAIFCAGGYYFVGYQEWDVGAATYVYRDRPFSGAVLGASVVASGVVLCGAAMLVLRVARRQGTPMIDDCPVRADVR
ncbi:hypothetical protein [Microbacterium sp. 5K110]|jgi:hypothetical protein|uniref:hypothetical protein n=1 Tax=unclassified Microbacterium TaxID=2609290 RepID=UPI0010FF01E0|nr:hypothetical protein [Microbacterium sp. 5K110]TLF29990.1 hypothetical protein FE256_11850 [Microbacterium sp. 5K110]